MEQKYELKKAFQIGFMCIFSYVVSYFVRNLLSVSTPEMLAGGKFTKEFIGTLSSFYFITYALGQLVNGVIGDKVKPKFMVGMGLVICGVASIMFGIVNLGIIQICIFVVMGFSLSMLRGPLVKTISENTIPKYARICCVFLSFAACSGPLIASFLSLLFNWRLMFIVSGFISAGVGIIAYIALDFFERKNIIAVAFKEKEEKKRIWDVFKLNKFVYYMFIGALTEIAFTSINFWVPTYLTERLMYSMDASKMIFSAMGVIRSCIPFVALYVFSLFKEKDICMIKWCFIVATVLFVGVLFITQKYINVVLFLLTLMVAGLASTVLWSVYIPSQSESKMVSTINGMLDFTGYAFAAGANVVFSFTMNIIGWNGIVVIWIVLMASGIAASVIQQKKETRGNKL